MRLAAFFLCSAFLCAVVLGQLEFVPSCPEETISLEDAAVAFRRDLRGKIVPFLLDTVLPNGENGTSGGYTLAYTVSGRGNSTTRQLASQARMLYSFSHLYNEAARNERQRQQLLDAADVGYAFLEEHFFDRVYGGYYWRVEDDGTPLRTEKNARGHMMVILAYVEYSRAKEDPSFAEQAQELYSNISLRLTDEEFDGFIEDFEADWQPIHRPLGEGPSASYGLKTQAFLVEMLEALTALFEDLERTNVEIAIEQILDNELDRFFPRNPANSVVSLFRNLSASNDEAVMSYGTLAHYAFVRVNAEKAIGLSPKWSTFTRYIQFVLDEGIEQGGLTHAGELVWWASDNLIMALSAAIENERGSASWNASLSDVIQFELCNLIDPTHGLSIWSVNRRGEPLNESVLAPWKAAFHEVRSKVTLVRATFPDK